MQINGAHWHLLLNHFPIILSITGTGLLVLSFFIRSGGFRNAALFIMIIAGLFAIPAYNTGESAEEVVEQSPVTSEQYLEQHEEIASTALLTILIAAAVALIAMAVNQWQNKWATGMLVIAVIASAVSTGFLVYTGLTGGKIMHAEIRNEAVTPNSPVDLPAAGETDDD